MNHFTRYYWLRVLACILILGCIDDFELDPPTTDTVSDVHTDSGTEIVSNSNIDTGTKADTDADIADTSRDTTDTNTDTTDTSADTTESSEDTTDTSTNTADTSMDTIVDTDSDTDAKTDTDTGADSDTDADADTESDTNIDFDTDATPVCTALKTQCESTCVDLMSDAQNCGRCGRACPESACSDGMCVPSMLHEQPTAGQPIQQLSVAGANVYFLEVTDSFDSYIRYISSNGNGLMQSAAWTHRTVEQFDTHGDQHFVYWLSSPASFGYCDLIEGLNGSSNFTSIDDGDFTLSSGIRWIKANDTHIIFATSMMSFTFEKISHQGGEPELIISNPGFSSGTETNFEVDNDRVYGILSAANGILSISIADGSTNMIVIAESGESIMDLALTESHVVFVSNTRIGIVEKNGANLSTVSSPGNTYLVTTDSQSNYAYYYQAQGESTSCSGGSTVYAIDLLTRESLALSHINDSCILHTASDSTSVYWLNSSQDCLYKTSR